MTLRTAREALAKTVGADHEARVDAMFCFADVMEAHVADLLALEPTWRELIADAREAAESDSNDDEIEALQAAVRAFGEVLNIIDDHVPNNEPAGGN